MILCLVYKHIKIKNRNIGGLLGVLDSILEAPFGLDVIQDLLKLLIFKSTLQTEHKHTQRRRLRLFKYTVDRLHSGGSSGDHTDLGIRALASSADSGHRLAKLANSNLWSFFCSRRLEHKRF